jgi:ATP-binding cassette subfamily F protein 3
VIQSLNLDFTDGTVLNILASFLITDSAVHRPLHLCSGGEKTRVALASLILGTFNTLILDEPTNHLDIPSAEALEHALNDYTGALIIVSHDRYFLDRTVDRILEIREGEWVHFNGTYFEYHADKLAKAKAAAKAASEKLEREKAERKRAAEKDAKDAKDGKDKPAKSVAPPKQDKSGSNAPPKKVNEVKLSRVEREIEKLEERKKSVMTKLEDPDIYKDATKVKELQSDLGFIEAELQDWNRQWMEIVG